MKDNISKELRKPLSIESVDFRVQSVSAKGYITILAYKDARVDMQRLDEVVGCLNWKREHTRDNKNCIVSIWDEDKKEWVSKEDTGSESFSEKEKGLASDSFKRACFNWGIGVELYDYPFIFFQLYPDEFDVSNNKAKTNYKFNLKKWKWVLDIDDKSKINKLTGFDDKGRIRFDSTKNFNSIPKTPTQQPAKTPQQPAKQPQKKTLPPMVENSDKWQAMVKLINEGKINTITQVEAKYTLTPVLKAKIVKLIKEYKPTK